MKAKSELHYTQLDINAAVEYYLNEEVFREEVRVTGVTEVNNGASNTFKINIQPKEAESE